MCLQTSVYKNVIDDVIRNVREEFLNEAVDLEVLEDLKRVRPLDTRHFG